MDFTPVFIASFPLDTFVDFDLFIKQANNQFVLYRSKELPFTLEARERLIYNKVECLYIQNTDKRKYQQFIEKNLTAIIADPQISSPKKADILYQASASMMEELFEKPEIGDNIERSANVARSAVEYLLQGRQSFFNLLNMSMHDYYTYTHSVHVCTYAIALAQTLGITDPRMLNDLGTGALLHDIGKSRVPKEIIQKKGPLTGEEMELMKKHPDYGLEIAEGADTISPLARYAIIQHQEKIDGTGYPHGLTESEIHIYGRITAIADVFDAMTTNRSYSKAHSFYDTLKFLVQERGTHLDMKLLGEFVKLLGDR